MLSCFVIKGKNSVKMILQMPPLLTWHICQIIVNSFSPIVTTHVLNQSRGHWLLSDAFNSTISIILKLKIELGNAFSFQTLMEKDSSVVRELICLASNIIKEVCNVLNSLLSFLRIYEKKTQY
jgi:hypothetical protein